ncbi:conserved protein of unknown function [Candidatus Filomicrobium marinum]|uniref:DUF2628 domain-containing protein n=1 Tax=Candidatus Filomicrobium marinum TaxID=1608628 RepID=A0A0D6JDW7_9HYPH|nr:DUF2628 domain-containing protein [Candidatus Filomicrobium marinum]CFX15552.1 conserved protein of unknown function [Candidatus Filomicrobium marinum]CPR17980.1 conserved protein of unknown function [Candidatus Filomicrobium marinum]
MILSLWRLGESSRVLAFTVHEPPNPPAASIERAERLVFTKDGFSFAALLLGPIWLLLNRMWIVLAIYVVIAFGIGAVLELLKVPHIWATLTGLALNFLIALEGDSLRRWTLERRGWQFVGTVVGRTTADCERRFFENWLPAQSAQRVQPATVGSVPAMAPLSPAAHDLGAAAVEPPPLPMMVPPQQDDSQDRRWRLFGRRN